MTAGRHFRDDDTVRLVPPADPWADPLTARRARPHCVYWLRGWGGEVVRVGITSDLDARMARYERDAVNPRNRVSRWWHLVAQPLVPEVRWHANWHEARAVEVAENGRLCPAGNYQDVPRTRRHRLHDAPPPPRPCRTPFRRRRTPWRVYLFLVLFAVSTVACMYVLTLLALPWEWVPPVLAPVFGVPLGWAATVDVLRRGRKLRAWR